MSSNRLANRLIQEKSPYLQQHAYNPVNWLPWGDEAFQQAHRENKPIFLSIGYSTCHWCHVMEHESFENAAIAEYLNQHFVPVKVDREERPDIDRVYMTYVQASTGSGGWPMSVWLTPDGKPFVGGTYFPPENRYGRPGFPLILERIVKAWSEDRDQIIASSERVLAELEQQAAVTPSHGSEAGAEALEGGFAVWRRSFDSRLGGFGQAPKFPRPSILNFLLRYHARSGNREALDMTLATLQAMSQGGMNDQLGGGFHRYSVDEYWLVPHFEKMLYDQAQVAVSLIEAFQVTGAAEYAHEARRVLDYVLRDMTDSAGGFYSAEDADSASDAGQPQKKSEGAFYIWSAAEIEAILGQPAARYFHHRFGVTAGGNVENDPHGEFTGRNILFAAHSVAETAHYFDQPEGEVRDAIAEACAKLLATRGGRPRPHLDDKVLTAWNGLMISAFAKAGAVLDDSRYAAAASRAADFLRTRMWNPETGVLLRRYRQNDAAIPGFLDDYAFFTQALLDLYEAQYRVEDLELALALTERQRVLFEDEKGAFFSTAIHGGDPRLVMRIKDEYDGAEPSGNSVAALNLLRLERITGRADLGESGRKTLRAFSARLQAQPYAVPQMMCALDFALSPPRQIILAGEPDDPATHEMRRMVWRGFQPNRIVLLVSNASREWLARGNPALLALVPLDEQTTAYVCENFACQLPVTEPLKLAELLQ